MHVYLFCSYLNEVHLFSFVTKTDFTDFFKNNIIIMFFTGIAALPCD
jgi:hypothetical protein